jgi:HEAT repeat protein
MKRVAGSLLLLAACAKVNASGPMSSAADTAEMDRQVRRLLAPSGDVQYARARGEALQWLLAHATDAYPRLLAIVDTPEPPALAIMALAEFQREDAVPVLERILHSSADPTVVVASSALARLSSARARVALERALRDERDQVVASAADALGERGDANACVALAAVVHHPNRDVRARIEKAATRLGCKGG